MYKKYLGNYKKKKKKKKKRKKRKKKNKGQETFTLFNRRREKRNVGPSMRLRSKVILRKFDAFYIHILLTHLWLF